MVRSYGIMFYLQKILKSGSTEIRTRVAGFKVQSATITP